MLITAPCVVSLTWKLQDAHGNAIDELTDPVEFLVGGDDLLRKVEEALIGQAAGYESTLHLEPEHAFGDYDAGLVFFEDRALFPAELDAGMQFDGVPDGATTPDLPPDAITFRREKEQVAPALRGRPPFDPMSATAASMTGSVPFSRRFRARRTVAPMT